MKQKLIKKGTTKINMKLIALAILLALASFVAGCGNESVSNNTSGNNVSIEETENTKPIVVSKELQALLDEKNDLEIGFYNAYFTASNNEETKRYKEEVVEALSNYEGCTVLEDGELELVFENGKFLVPKEYKWESEKRDVEKYGDLFMEAMEEQFEEETGVEYEDGMKRLKEINEKIQSMGGTSSLNVEEEDSFVITKRLS